MTWLLLYSHFLFKMVISICWFTLPIDLFDKLGGAFK
jgi:hypothetical protein